MKSRVSENRPCPGPSEVGSQQSMGGSEVTFLPPEGVYCQVGTCPIDQGIRNSRRFLRVERSGRVRSKWKA